MHRGTMPPCIISLIGGFFSRLNNFLQVCVAINCVVSSDEFMPATISSIESRGVGETFSPTLFHKFNKSCSVSRLRLFNN